MMSHAWKGTTQRPLGNPPCKENLGGHGEERPNLKTCCFGPSCIGHDLSLVLELRVRSKLNTTARLLDPKASLTSLHLSLYPGGDLQPTAWILKLLQVEFQEAEVNYLRFSPSSPVGNQSPHLLARLAVAP